MNGTFITFARLHSSQFISRTSFLARTTSFIDVTHYKHLRCAQNDWLFLGIFVPENEIPTHRHINLILV